MLFYVDRWSPESTSVHMSCSVSRSDIIVKSRDFRRNHKPPCSVYIRCRGVNGCCHIEPRGSTEQGNPFGDHVFLGAATAVAYKTASWGGCGRHLSPGMSSKVATDGPFEAVLGKTHRTEF